MEIKLILLCCLRGDKRGQNNTKIQHKQTEKNNKHITPLHGKKRVKL